MRFILLNGRVGSDWGTFLEEALSPIGQLFMVDENAALTMSAEPGDVWLVDATIEAEHEVAGKVLHLRSQQPDRRIVVMTAAPTWERARAAFAAGAIDYVPQTLDQVELLSAMIAITRKPLPPWPR